jgi:hypothetical protein
VTALTLAEAKEPLDFIPVQLFRTGRILPR